MIHNFIILNTSGKTGTGGHVMESRAQELWPNQTVIIENKLSVKLKSAADGWMYHTEEKPAGSAAQEELRRMWWTVGGNIGCIPHLFLDILVLLL